MGDIEKILKEGMESFAGLLGAGMYIMPPDNNFLNYHPNNLKKLEIHRDEKKELIGRYQGEDTYSVYDCADRTIIQKVDFGDSATKTGTLAFINSKFDQAFLPLYEKDGIMVRHPNQPPWNNPNNFTRDQLIGFAAGCWRAKRYDIMRRVLDKHYQRLNAMGLPLCQNSEDNCPGTGKGILGSDFLTPEQVMYLEICAGNFGAYLNPVGQFNLQLAIEATDKDVELEKIPLILRSIVCGRLDLYLQVHENYKENIRHYYKGQVQEQIGEALIDVIEIEIRRYSGQLKPATLGIPFDTIRSVIRQELFEILFQAKLYKIPNYIENILTALGSDIQKISKQVENYISNAIKNPLSILNFPFMPFNPLAKLINNLFNGTDLSEVYSRLNEIQNGILEVKILSERIIQDIAKLPGQTSDKVRKDLYIDGFTQIINQFKVDSDGFYNELQLKDLKTAKENYEKILRPYIFELPKSFSQYTKFEISYATLPTIINFMNMHLSCISMWDGPLTSIKSHIKNTYKPIILSIINDESQNSLNRRIKDLKTTQENNINYVSSLYYLTFIVENQNGVIRFREPIEPQPGKGKQINSLPNNPNNLITYDSTPYDFIINGRVLKYDFIFNEIYDTTKINRLAILIERNILPQYYFPKIITKQTISNEVFSLTGNTGIAPYPLLTTEYKTESFEARHNINPFMIWEHCKNQLNVESNPYPRFFDTNIYDSKCNSIIETGENLITHALLLAEGQLALERMEEILAM